METKVTNPSRPPLQNDCRDRTLSRPMNLGLQKYFTPLLMNSFFVTGLQTNPSQTPLEIYRMIETKARQTSQSFGKFCRQWRYAVIQIYRMIYRFTDYYIYRMIETKARQLSRVNESFGKFCRPWRRHFAVIQIYRLQNGDPDV